MNTREQWLKERTTGIGGSDIAAVLGLSKWRTPLDVYRDKRGEAEPQPENSAMRWGRYLEPVVRQAYADETGREVRMLPDMLRHPEYAFLIANLDGFVAAGQPGTSVDRIFEAKTARSGDGWGEPGSDQIPREYALQVQHYMNVARCVVADVAVLIGGSDFRIYEVPSDPELQAMMMDAAAEFWERVQNGNPPEPVTYADAIARYGRSSRNDSVMATADVMDAVEHLREIKTQSKHLDSAKEEWEALLFIAMGECDTLIDATGNTLATWKAAAAPKRFDSAAFKSAHADMYEQFVRIGEPSRRLLIK